jgi:hypothetical protein
MSEPDEGTPVPGIMKVSEDGRQIESVPAEVELYDAPLTCVRWDPDYDSEWVWVTNTCGQDRCITIDWVGVWAYTYTIPANAAHYPIRRYSRGRAVMLNDYKC